MLVDAEGLPPHQRESGRIRLDGKAEGVARRRLLSLFDRGFDPRVTSRVQTAVDLESELGRLLVTGETEGADSMEQMFDEIARDARRIEVRDQISMMESFARHAIYEIDSLAKENSMEVVQGGFMSGPAPVPWARTTLAIRHGVETDNRMRGGAEYRFESRGAEVVFLGAEVELWRGADQNDPELNAAVRRFAKENVIKEAASEPADGE